ncbi:hypothetical protein L9F63_009777 [Diploptera punctata]|uniref:Uncharacterized protein n=1 Tax=Diploptera punctata TaxID=6984 RepID=A0AAD8AIS7_DIPPU|nr:hypothetical protein L9F63_009777 [Diploptera punctata]
MSDNTKSIVEDNCVVVQSGKRDDVKFVAQTHSDMEPSVDEVKNSNENNGAKDLDEASYRRRRKTRRGKSKRRKLKPYSKLTWQERRQQDDNQSKRANKVRAQMFAHGQPVAPYNTTQFLMEDHNDLQDLDSKLRAVSTSADRLRSNSVYQRQQSRVRDSSLSVDSEDEYFYSSPEDEEEFLTKEFSNAYEDLHAERLHQLSKSELIIDKESTPKIQLFQQEINKLLKENEQLRRENEHLRESCKKRDRASSVSSVDSESDSSCSSASDSPDSSGSKESVLRTSDTNIGQLE